jgi:hypothetical protein
MLSPLTIIVGGRHPGLGIDVGTENGVERGRGDGSGGGGRGGVREGVPTGGIGFGLPGVPPGTGADLASVPLMFLRSFEMRVQ